MKIEQIELYNGNEIINILVKLNIESLKCFIDNNSLDYTTNAILNHLINNIDVIDICFIFKILSTLKKDNINIANYIFDGLDIEIVSTYHIDNNIIEIMKNYKLLNENKLNEMSNNYNRVLELINLSLDKEKRR